jgi:hypothetical protein
MAISTGPETLLYENKGYFYDILHKFINIFIGVDDMNSLTTTRVFQAIDKLFNVKNIVGNPSFPIESYIIPKEHYSYLLSAYRGYKYPLNKQILYYANNNETLPLLLKYPLKDNAKTILFTTSITGFLRQYDGRLTSFVDISSKGKYEWNKTSKEIEFFKIYERDFYAFLQNAAVNKILHDKANALVYNPKFTKHIVEIFAFLVGKAISILYPVGATAENIDILNYITGVFAYQNFFNFDMDKAKEYTLSLRGIDKSNIINKCIYYKHDEEKVDMKYDVVKKVYKNDEKDIFPVDVYLGILNEEFPFIKSGHMEFRTLTAQFCNLYGGNAILALEHCGSFINMIKTAVMRVGLYKDLLIEKNAGSYVDELDKLLASSL